MTDSITKGGPYYVFVAPGEKFVAIDRSTGPMASGGYPHLVDEIHRAKWWHDHTAARRYQNRCDRDADWKLYAIKSVELREVISG